MKRRSLLGGLVSGWLALLSAPGVVLAKAPGCTEMRGDVQSLGCLADVVISLVDKALLFLGFIMLAVFLYGATRFIVSRGDAKAIEAAQKTVTYAVIGTALILLSFIIINVFTNSLGLTNLLDKFTLYQP